MSFSDLIRDARTRDEYWIEDAIIGFTVQLYSWMKEKGMSQADLAARIGASQPYVARILKGNDNFTIATMIKLVRAVGAHLQIVLREADENPAVETGIGRLVVSEAADSLIRFTARSSSLHCVESVH
ncbi:MAG TPA: helix-turn-helix transcriptional regulator [Thermoanaerobaculia bacterium]|nr:helix-turn-helix transcriptional regulator [Thermoanaerobaculia bacterium]